MNIMNIMHISRRHENDFMAAFQCWRGRQFHICWNNFLIVMVLKDQLMKRHGFAYESNSIGIPCFFDDFNLTNSDYKFRLYKMRDRFAISAQVKF